MFITKLNHLFVSDQAKTLNFFYKVINENSIFSGLIEFINGRPIFKMKLEKEVLNLICKQLFAPFIYPKLFSYQFFQHKIIDKLFKNLLCNSYEKVKLSIFFFNKTINNDDIDKYYKNPIRNSYTTFLMI